MDATIDTSGSGSPNSCYRLYYVDASSVLIWSGVCTDQAGVFLNDGTVTMYNATIGSISVM